MTTDQDLPNQDFPPADDRRPAGAAWLAWAVIVLATVLVIALQAAAPRLGPTDGRLERALFEVQAKYLLGAAKAFEGQAADPLQQTLEQWQAAAGWHRVRLAVLAGELSGPDAALDRLEAAGREAVTEDADDQPAPREILIQLYRDYAEDEFSAPSVSEAERRRLENELGWFGRLALAPEGADSPVRDEAIAAARRTFYGVIAGVLAVGVVGLAGLFLLIVFLALLFSGRLSGLAVSRGYGGVYAEAFACWLVLFLGLNVLGSLWLGREAVAAISLLALGGSLLAVAWPVARGVPWRQVREDLGWTAGRRPVRETFLGIGGYAMALPLVILAAILVAVALGLAGENGLQSGGAPAHPVAEKIAEGGWWIRVQLLLLACLVAPVVEETMFRGFLYRHLREATGARRRWASVLLSAVVSSVLFAMLHPQGLPGIPGITGIALALAFMRE